MDGLTTNSWWHCGHSTAAQIPIVTPVLSAESGRAGCCAALSTRNSLGPVAGAVERDAVEHLARDVLFEVDAGHGVVGALGDGREGTAEGAGGVDDHDRGLALVDLVEER